MSIMHKRIHDMYVYFLGMQGTEEKLYGAYEDWKNDKSLALNNKSPGLYYKGYILEIDCMIDVLKQIKNGY